MNNILAFLVKSWFLRWQIAWLRMALKRLATNMCPLMWVLILWLIINHEAVLENILSHPVESHGEFWGGWVGSSRPKHLKGGMKLNWDFWRGEVQTTYVCKKGADNFTQTCLKHYTDALASLPGHLHTCSNATSSFEPWWSNYLSWIGNWNFQKWCFAVVCVY